MPPLGTYGLRVPASRVGYVPDAQGGLPPGRHVLYVRGTRTSHGRTIRTAYRGTPGRNNGASSGVLKSTDRGKTWVPHCNGLWDTTISSLHIVDEAGDHVLAGTPTGI